MLPNEDTDAELLTDPARDRQEDVPRPKLLRLPVQLRLPTHAEPTLDPLPLRALEVEFPR